MIKKISYTLLALLALVLAAMIAIPWLYEDEIKQLLKEEVNRSVTATIDFEDVSISLFRHFPDVSLKIDDLRVTEGKDSIPGDTIALVKSVDISLDVMTVIRKTETVMINGVFIIEPDLRIEVSQEGRANYDFFIQDTSTSAAPGTEAVYDLQLEDYAIRDGKIRYHDRSNHLFLEMPDLTHEGSGSFRENTLSLSTTTESGTTDLQYSGISYLTSDNINADIDLEIDLDRSEYRISKGGLAINDLRLLASGVVRSEEDKIPMEISFEAPGNDFGDLWSAVPEVFKADLKEVRTTGSFQLSGRVDGEYDTKTGSMPAIEIDLKTTNGSIAYPDLPQRIEKINADINYLRRAADNINFVNIKTLTFEAGKSTFKTRAELSQSSSGSHIAGFLDSDLDLSDLPLDGSYSGGIKADITFNGKIEDVQRQAYDQLELTGNAQLQDVTIPQDGSDAMVINSPDIVFSSKEVSLSSFSLDQGQTSVNGKARITDPLGFLCPEIRPHLNLQLNAERLDFNQWATSDEDGTGSDSPGTTSSLLPFDITMDAEASLGLVLYEDYELKDLSGRIGIDGQKISLLSVRFTYFGEEISISGDLDNAADYVYNDGNLTGQLSISSDNLDLNQINGGEETTGDDGSTSAYVLPENIDLIIYTDIARLVYEGYELRDLNGDLKLSEQQLDMTRLTSRAFGGRMNLIGSYRSTGTSPASFNLKYDIFQMPFSSVYQHIVSIRELAPLAEFIDGIFNSSLLVQGNLADGMMPELSTLTASGYIETLNGKLEGLPFLDELSKKIAVSSLQDISIEDTKNWFEIKDGNFILEPFTIKHEGIEVGVMGKTSLDRSIDLALELFVPREKVDQLPGGAAVGRGLDWIKNEVSGIGINISEINTFVFDVNIKGMISSPRISINSVNAINKEGKESGTSPGKDLKNKIIDSLENRKQEVVEETREKVEKEVEEVSDSLKKKAEEKLEKVGEDLKKKGQEVLDSSANDEVKKKAGEILGEDPDKKIEDMKKKLEEFNPFKKKK